MTISAEQLIEQIEAAGGTLSADGEKIHCLLPEDATPLLDDLRARKPEILALLRERTTIPPIPSGVRLIQWDPKPAPVILTHYAVVTDVVRFITSTLLELRAALAGKPFLAGHHSVRELVDRLEQCGVLVQVLGAGQNCGTSDAE